jgi:hypothetical protein
LNLGFGISNGNGEEKGRILWGIFISDKRTVWVVGFKGNPWEGYNVDFKPLDWALWNLIGWKE